MLMTFAPELYCLAMPVEVVNGEVIGGETKSSEVSTNKKRASHGRLTSQLNDPPPPFGLTIKYHMVEATPDCRLTTLTGHPSADHPMPLLRVASNSSILYS